MVDVTQVTVDFSYLQLHNWGIIIIVYGVLLVFRFQVSVVSMEIWIALFSITWLLLIIPIHTKQGIQNML